MSTRHPLRLPGFVGAFALLVCVAPLPADSARPAHAPTAENFDRLRDLIRPQPGEAKWAQLPWLTSLTEARKMAAEQDKPLLIWAAGGGHQLGRC